MDNQLCPDAKPDRTWTLLYDPRHENVADGLQRQPTWRKCFRISRLRCITIMLNGLREASKACG